MTSTPPAENQTQDPSATPTAPDFSVTMQEFWEKNRFTIAVVCVAALVGIIGYQGWQKFAESREADVQKEFSEAAAASPEKLAKFADEHSGHALAGVALLQIADGKYKAGDFKGAQAAYMKSVESLSNDALKSRARLGAAMSQIATGDQAGGEAALKTLSADGTVFASVRAEATYHLAALANEAGKTEDVKKLVEQVSKIDGSGIWARRAMVLRAQLPEDAKPAAANQFQIK